MLALPTHPSKPHMVPVIVLSHGDDEDRDDDGDEDQCDDDEDFDNNDDANNDEER